MMVSVVGLGKLGACMAAAIASRGHAVVGVDVDEHTVAEVNARRPPVAERGLAEAMAAAGGLLCATTDHVAAVCGTDITFVVVPTPSAPDGGFETKYAEAACEAVGRGLAKKAGYHVVVLSSTVLPGATRALAKVLEQASGKVCGRGFGLCYSPEFIALGSVVHDFLHPDFTLVGEHDERAGLYLQHTYSQFMAQATPCKRMSLENAELAKVALNAYVTMKMAYANMLADLCEQLPGGDVDVVCDAIGTDSRIGHRYLKGASAYGGPCFPRDNLALCRLAEGLHVEHGLPAVVDHANGARARRLPAIPRSARVAVLGLAYKPGTHVTERSHGMALAAALRSAGYDVHGHDPLAAEGAWPLAACLAWADTVFITTPDPAYADLRMPPNVQEVHDYWRVLKHTVGFKYVATGRGAA